MTAGFFFVPGEPPPPGKVSALARTDEVVLVASFPSNSCEGKAGDERTSGTHGVTAGENLIRLCGATFP